MNRMKQISLTIPKETKQLIDLSLKVKPPNFKYEKEQFYYFVFIVMTIHTMHKDKWGIFLPKKKIISVLGIRGFRAIKHYLVNIKALEMIKSSHKENRPETFRLSPIENVKMSHINIENTLKTYNFMKQQMRNGKAHINRLPLYLKLMYDKVMSLDFDYEGMKQWIEQSDLDNPKKLSYMMMIFNIEHKDNRWFNRNKTNNRLDTNITNIKSDLLKYIKGDYVEIDLKNSQIYLFSKYINKITKMIKEGKCNPLYIIHDTLHFISLESYDNELVTIISTCHQMLEKSGIGERLKLSDLTREGVFYNYFSDLLNITRDEAKKMMFEVLFSANYSTKQKKIFANEFPLTYELASAFKEEEHNKLAIELQKMESYIFIDLISQELVMNNITPITKHDSVIVEKEYSSQTLAIMKSVFMRLFGEIPTFKIKPLN